MLSTSESSGTMADDSTFQDQITPYWTDKELDEVLNPSEFGDERIQRNKLKKAIETQTDCTSDLGVMLSSLVSWKNKDKAIKLWAGHINKAEESRFQSYSSPEAVEAGLIEHFGQPVFQEEAYDKAKLVDLLVPVIQASPVSELRPGVWDDDQKSQEQVKEVLNEYIEDKEWSRR